MTLSRGTFYTYLWLRSDGTPYYVGKGKWRGHRFVGQERAFRKGCPPASQIIVESHESQADAFFAESFLIGFYGRIDLGTGCLRNRTNGGEGLAGLLRSATHKSRISAALSRRKSGNPVKHYDPIRHSQLMTGEGNPLYGVKRSFDETWRAKLSAGKTGRTISEETRARMKASALKRWANKNTDTCIRGHRLTPDNVRVGKRESRFCIACDAVRHAELNARNQLQRMIAK